MIDYRSKYSIGQKLRVTRRVDFYGKDAIVEVAGFNNERGSNPIRFHGIVGLDGYSSRELAGRIRRDYPNGCFSIEAKYLKYFVPMIQDWDE